MRSLKILSILTICLIFMSASSCDFNPKPPTSDSGIAKASAKIQVQSNGLTIEQNQVSKRLIEDNKVGSIKYLYVISAYSGQTLIYSTVKGKVTSSYKRLNPSTVSGEYDPNNNYAGNMVNIGSRSFYTSEVLGDDGTYGSSSEYIYWWDTKGVYHQHFNSGGQIIHISDQPLNVKSVIINMEVSKNE